MTTILGPTTGIRSSQLLAVAALSFVVYQVTLIVYRLYLCPVAKFPGPKLAAASFWYEFYFDVVKLGRYAHKIDDLHKRYGPIVRINPCEIHINDPQAYQRIYVEASQRRSDRWSFPVNGVNLPGILGLTIDHDLHRMRRSALNPFFSKQQVLRLEPVINENISKLCRRLNEYKGAGTTVNLNCAYAALAGDIVTQYCFARSYAVLDEPDFAPHWEDVNVRITQFGHLFNHFPSLIKVLRKIPPRIMSAGNPVLKQFFDREIQLGQQISAIKSGKNSAKNSNQKTIFHDLIYNSKLPPTELTIKRLQEEGTGIIAAGSVTTARTLYLISYYLILRPDVLARLQQELDEKEIFAAYPERRPSWVDLEKLPYLTAVLREGLRLAYGVVHRLARVFPDHVFTYDGWSIPPGTPISFSICDLHENPDIFPEPQKFDPERWLATDPETRKRFEQSWWPFSKGSRNCIGLNLAWAELYLTVATVFRRGGIDFELFETTEKDVLYQRDFGAPQGDDMGSSRLLELPFDVRAIILHYTLVAGPFETASVFLGRRVRNLVDVKANRAKEQALPRSNGVALLATCHQLHDEGAEALYGHLAIDLDYNNEEDNGDRTLDFLARIGAKNRALIQWIQLRCFSASSPHAVPLCEWRNIMHTIASDCVSLKEMTLNCPTDEEEQQDFLQTCYPSAEWVRATRRVATKARVQLHFPAFGPLAADHDFCTGFVPWFAGQCDVEEQETPAKEDFQASFPFLALPEDLQRRTISLAVLPPGQVIHPFLSPRVDQATLIAIPLLLTSKLVHRITEEVLYSEAIFAACVAKYGKHLIAFFHRRPVHQLN
ncbi:MAG: hypothetical protein LQ348_001050 [Seirophora lacunosa]|nr:MAG: hypothetical protein LQ348_001050 [Seirophora lacunosa]